LLRHQAPAGWAVRFSSTPRRLAAGLPQRRTEKTPGNWLGDQSGRMSPRDGVETARRCGPIQNGSSSPSSRSRRAVGSSAGGVRGDGGGWDSVVGPFPGPDLGPEGGVGRERDRRFRGILRGGSAGGSVPGVAGGAGSGAAADAGGGGGSATRVR